MGNQDRSASYRAHSLSKPGPMSKGLCAATMLAKRRSTLPMIFNLSVARTMRPVWLTNLDDTIIDMCTDICQQSRWLPHHQWAPFTERELHLDISSRRDPEKHHLSLCTPSELSVAQRSNRSDIGRCKVLSIDRSPASGCWRASKPFVSGL
jgi:hypothetical protein